MDLLVNALKAAGEPTRLRILAAVHQGELTVSDLCRVLGQSQPRVSRHLKLLCEAGLLVRHAEGSNAFFRASDAVEGRRVFEALHGLIPLHDELLLRDQERITAIRAERAKSAASYFSNIASSWDTMRRLHVADAEVEQAMLDTVGSVDEKSVDLLDVGTGTGRILELFADRVDVGLGIDASREMLNVARSHIEQKRLRNCSVRLGNVYDLRVPSATFDVAVLHHVLHFLDDPATAITEAARTLRRNGRLLIVDFATHSYEHLRVTYAHRRLGFSAEEISLWCHTAGLSNLTSQTFSPTADGSELAHGEAPLVITLWVAEQNHPVSTVSKPFPLEVAS
jgi:ubiquinone/menaquinone biosynthesis C-methylase UbiE/DNA-binding transcriptional ArsR family regulator